jgi:hypothetical protein
VTPEHVPHVVYLIRGTIDREGRYWLRVQLPVLPNGSAGWIPREAVGQFRSVDTHLVIDRSRFRATLYRRGRPVFQSIVGVGLAHWPTPAGRFHIRERLTGFTDPIYGALAFGTNARSPRPDGLAGRRIRRHSRDESARHPPRACFTRLRQAPEPGHREARSAHTRRYAGDRHVADHVEGP